MALGIKKYLSILLLSIFIFGFSLSANANIENADEPEKYVSVSVVTDKNNLTPNDVIRLGVKKDIYPKWHTYWINPGDSGLAADIQWDLPKGYTVSDLEWPTPKKINLGELTNYGHEGETILLQNLNVPTNVSSDPITITGVVNLLVCHDICIPETHEVSVTFNAENDLSNAAKIQEAESALPTPISQTATFYNQGDNLVIDIEGLETKFNLDHIAIAPEEWGLVLNPAKATIQKTDNGYTISQKKGERDIAEVQELDFVIYSDNENQSYALSAVQDTSKQSAIAATGPTPASSEVVSDNPEKSSTTFQKAFFFALVGGLILNLMPCVFPVLSMKALSLVQLGDKEEKKARFYGLSYTAGILLSFALIASILIALKSAGAEIGWGFQLQNPVVISVLIYLVFIIGLNLFGFFEFSNSFGNFGQKLAGQSGNKGAFFTGVLATLVATPCTAPFMGVAMGYALTQGAAVSLLIFLALGFGLALPYLALCFIPQLRTKLPKPGAWMEVFKQFLSFPMFLTAAFLVWVLSQQTNSFGVLIILSALVAIVFTIWLWRHLPAGNFFRALCLSFLILTAGFSLYAPFSLKAAVEMNTNGAVKESIFTNEKLEQLLEGDKAIFTNMTAAWCITCKVNERIAIKTNTVQNIFIEKDVEYLKGDWTNQNPEITNYLNSFDRQGVPLYVFYGARNEMGERPEPILLPQILTKSIVEDALLNN